MVMDVCHRWLKLSACGYAMIGVVSVTAGDFDPFQSRDAVSESAEKTMLGPGANSASCQSAKPLDQLNLASAVEMALCNNPQTRQAWANVKVQAAQVGIAKAAYLPSVEVTGTRSKGYYDSQVKDFPALDYQQHSTAHDIALDLSWTLYDFGLRKANLENERQVLAAANSTQDATLQTVFANTAQAYYDLQSADGALDANKEAEQAAKESFEATDAKYKAGVGALADKLQAQTNYAQARLSRSKAEGDAKNARGVLAATMGLPPNAVFALTPLSSQLPNTAFVQSVDKLMELAKRQHPSLLAAQAQVKAAEAAIASAKAEGLPTISLIGNLDRNEQPGQYSLDTTTNTSAIGVQLKIPLFEGMGRLYRVQAAKAQYEGKVADLANVELQISLDVWKSYQALSTGTENLQTADELLQSAAQSFKVAQGRYKSGVGTIIELLNAQTALANAKQQQIQLLSNWRIARIKLAASLGQLGMWAVR
jgi:outer membrane protein